jgi:hypothetical protein
VPARFGKERELNVAVITRRGSLGNASFAGAYSITGAIRSRP